MSKILRADFVTTATKPSQYPPEKKPEIAFVGRSNVGKSSMINALAQRTKLVRVSNTPGRTRTLNFFDVDLDARGTVFRIRLCDLPGYGFAKVSKTERDQWREMIGTYLLGRPQLCAVVSIVDAEVGATNDDVTMVNFLQESPARILVVGTKLDRLGKAKRKPALHQLAQRLEIPQDAVVGFSAVDGQGRDEVWGRLLDAVQGK